MNHNNHIDHENLVGYVNRTLSDVNREGIDDHLLHCPICRTKLSLQEEQYGRISTSLRSEVNAITPPASMNFSTVPPGLRRRRFTQLWPYLSTALPLASAVTGLVLAVIGLWQVFGPFSLTSTGEQAAFIPTIACFFLAFVSVGQFDQSLSIRPRFILAITITIILWLGTAALGLLNILTIRDLAILSAYNLGRASAEISSAAILAVILAAITYIIVVIGGAEFHYRNIGRSVSWKVFSWTIMAQLFLIVLPFLIY